MQIKHSVTDSALSFWSSPRTVSQAAGLILLSAFLLGVSATARAQSAATHKLVEDVIYNELHASQTDHTKWMYRDAYKSPTKDTVQLKVNTAQSTLSKTILMNGRPLTPEEKRQDRAKMESLVNDPDARAKARKSSAHDDQQAVALMKMLPGGFLWTKVSESNGEITLRFTPNPAFQPPTYASRVFAAMKGEMVVDTAQKRLKMLSGTLTQPVEFGWGLLGKLQAGGTFQIVRSQVAPGEWQITQTHVHIVGHALFFKDIGDQEDEQTSHYKRTPPGLSLTQAAHMLNDGTVARELGTAPEK